MLMWANMNFSEAYMAESQGVKKKRRTISLLYR